jgi:hypothetical protein
MKHKSLVKALASAGLTAEGGDGSFQAINGDMIVKWSKQDDDAVCLVKGRVSNPGDVQTDYFPYFSIHTIREAIEHLESK